MSAGGGGGVVDNTASSSSDSSGSAAAAAAAAQRAGGARGAREKQLSDGEALAQKFVDSDGNLVDDLNWKRNEDLDAEAVQLLQWYEGSLDLDARQKTAQETEAGGGDDEDGDVAMASVDGGLAAGTQSSNGAVEHLGHGVHAYRAGDGTTSSTAIRADTRNMAHEVIEFLELEEDPQDPDPACKLPVHDAGHVAMVGNADMDVGKSRACLQFTLQALLRRRELVLRVRYTDKEVDVFVPGVDRSGRGLCYRGWSTSIAKIDDWYSELTKDTRTFVLIDPPTNGSRYTDRFGYGARVIRFKIVAGNGPRFRGYERDVFPSMPSEEEVIAMTPVAWSEATPFAGQDEFSDAGKKEEVRKRCRLVGCVPGLVFDASKFASHLNSLVESYEKLGLDRTNGLLCRYVFGWRVYGDTNRYLSGKLEHFLFDGDTRDHDAVWATLAPVTAFLFRNKLDMLLRRNMHAKVSLFAATGPKLLRTVVPDAARRVQVRPQALSDVAPTILRLRLRDGDTRSIVVGRGYPLIDFATSRLHWYCSHVGARLSKVRASAFVDALLGLKLARKEDGKLTMTTEEKIHLTLLHVSTRYRGVPKRILKSDLRESEHHDLLYKDVAQLFSEHVTVSAHCVWSDLQKSYDETRELWQYFKGQGAELGELDEGGS